jgi:RimJ/RimL family protein N-acetyltransferase
MGELGWTVVVVGGPDCPIIGSAGFHGPPDDRGRLEIGFSVDPAVRHLGYAAEAMQALVAWARSRHGVSRFLVSLPSVGEASRAAPVELDFPATATPDDLSEAWIASLEVAADHDPRG